MPANSRKRNGKPLPAIAGRVVPDQLTVSVQDPHWLQVAWEVGRSSLDRAAAALGGDWHRAVAVLRVVDVTGNDHSRGVPRQVQEIELPSGTASWYVRVERPDRTYRVSVGFRARSGRYHQIIQSRPVHPDQSMSAKRPAARAAAHVDNADGWPLDLYAGRCHIPSEAADHSDLTAGEAAPPVELSGCPLAVEAELIVRGVSAADARLWLMGKPVSLSADGCFCQRVPLQPGRQVVPVVAAAANGMVERTVVLAVELGVRELEPRLYGEL